MTRFARAKGSKASNEKAPEDGTPWEVMKEQLSKAKKESEDAKKRQEVSITSGLISCKYYVDGTAELDLTL